MFSGHRGPGWFPTSLPLFILIYAVLYYKHYRHLPKGKQLRYTLFWCYAFLLFDITQAPIPYTKDAFQHIQDYHHFRYNIVPFGSSHLLQFRLNIILFMPLGFVVSSLRKHYGVLSIMLAGLTVSLAIELLQLTTSLLSLNVRSFDVDDLITNTLGAILGYLLYQIYKFIKTLIRKQ